jgi:prepilin-type N-terminal cleavage/methylation domain-containing protein
MFLIYSKNKHQMRGGFTIVELVIALAIVVILTAAVLVSINPPQQLAKGRNAQRISHITYIMNAIVQNIADNAGAFSCSSGPIPSTSTVMASSAGSYNIAPCLVPAYLPSLPFDPSASGAYYASSTNYNTGYTIFSNASTGRITVAAPFAELGETIFVTR